MSESSKGNQSRKNDLWCGIPLEVIGGTGEFGTGKTLFGLTICPGPETLVYDAEGSTTAYQSLGFERVDVAQEMLRKYPRGQCKPIDMFTWWKQDVFRRVEERHYRVLMIDPVSEIENGLAQYVEHNPMEFGFTSKQFERSGGLFWGAVKDCWKGILDALRVRVDTIYFTAHMRNEFRGNAPTGKREAKGKETLMELASLYLEFQRLPDKKGNRPDVPSANVLKSRLAVPARNADGFIFNAEGDIQMIDCLPPRIPKATPGSIRNYIKNPPDYSKLKAEERVVERELSEVERLAMQAQIAERTADAEQAKVEGLRLQQEAIERAEQRRMQQRPAHDQSANIAQAKREQAAAAKSEVRMITDSQYEEIRKILEYIYDGDKAKMIAEIHAQGVQKLAELTEDAATDFTIEILRKKADKQAVKAKEMLAEQEAAKALWGKEQPPFDVGGESAGPSKSQLIERIGMLIAELEIPVEDVQAWHAKRKVNSFLSWDASDLLEVATKLEALTTKN